MPSPRVLQAQLQDLLEACQGDTRLKGVVEALEGALGTLKAPEDAPPSPGQQAARGDHEEGRSYYRPPTDEPRGPRTFSEAREAASTAMSEGNAG